MEQKDILNAVAMIHNGLMDINVRGDDAIRMGEIIKRCRALVVQLQNSPDKGDDAIELR